MKTLEELKQKREDTRAAWVLVCDIWSVTYAANTAGAAAAEAAWAIAWDAYAVACAAYDKKLEEANENT